MARSGTFALVLLALLALVNCSSDQPQGTGTQVIQVLPLSAAASYPLECFVDVWDLYQDVNLNNQPDDADVCVGIVCGDYVCAGDGGVQAVPWSYNLQITVIRAGEVVKTVVTPSSAASSFGSLTSGDARVRPVQGAPLTPAPAGYYYLHPRSIPETSAEFVRWCASFLNVPTPNMAGLAEPSSPGICQGTTPLPWEVEVQDGDTVIVDVGFAVTALGPYVDPSFNAFMTLNGRQVVPNGITSGIGIGTHLSFSYSVR